MNAGRILGSTLLAASACSTPAQAQVQTTCSARSGAAATPVVELYTSEGCNSCPPADRWLSRLKAEPGVVALAFHVDYWDRLGWKDRFASAAFTQRQAQQQAVNGARFNYTPQLVIDGLDRKDWPSLALPLNAPSRARTSPVAIELVRDADRVNATLRAAPGAVQELAAYWAVTEHEHVTAVKAGENRGSTLHHDFVVRELVPLAPFRLAPDTPASFAFRSPPPAAGEPPRELSLVVTDARSGRPVQALRLRC